MKFLTLNLKKNLFTILFASFIVCLVLFSKSNMESAKAGLTLWATSVVPTLFPFFVGTELLYRTNFVIFLGKIFTKFMRPVFNLPGESAIAFILGNISGYPVGAKLACNLLENKQCTKVEAERLIAFTNNSGPLFIVGTVGVSMFYSKEIGLVLLLCHFLASLTVGILFKNYKKDKDDLYKRVKSALKKDSPTISLSNLGEILGESIKNSINLILTIGGFIVLFSVIISILNESGILTMFVDLGSYFNIPENISKAVLSGILEVTNGLKISSSLQTKSLATNIILSSFLLGFGGISVMLQVYSVISKQKLSIKPYIYGKFLQSIFSIIYICLLLQAFPFLTYTINQL